VDAPERGSRREHDKKNGTLHAFDGVLRSAERDIQIACQQQKPIDYYTLFTEMARSRETVVAASPLSHFHPIPPQERPSDDRPELQ